MTWLLKIFSTYRGKVFLKKGLFQVTNTRSTTGSLGDGHLPNKSLPVGSPTPPSREEPWEHCILDQSISSSRSLTVDTGKEPKASYSSRNEPPV